jgi:Cu/Ag efflux pump CusA
MLVIGLAFLGLIGLLGTRLGSEFLPHLEEGNLWIRVAMPPTLGLDAGTPATAKLREIMMRQSSRRYRSMAAPITAATHRHSRRGKSASEAGDKSTTRQAFGIRCTLYLFE